MSSISKECAKFFKDIRLDVATCHPTQINKMTRSFYAGQANALAFLTEYVPTLSDDAGCEAISERLRELSDYATQFRNRS